MDLPLPAITLPTVCLQTVQTFQHDLTPQVKEAHHRLQDEVRVLGTEKRRLEAQLALARCNMTKAEELLNNKERCVGLTR